MLKKNLLINAANISIAIKIKTGKYISGSLINLTKVNESFLLIKFPTPAPNAVIMNVLGTIPKRVAKKYLFIFILKITGKIFCIAKGMPPPVNLNNKKYKKSFLLNKLINFSILVDSFFFIKSLKKKFAR